MCIRDRFKNNQRVDSMKELLTQGFDAVFVGCGAPRGRVLDLPGHKQAEAGIHIGIDWLASVSFGHVTSVGPRVIVLGGGNTAMDCCRSARRLGGSDVKVIVRSGFEEMKASPWEKEDAFSQGEAFISSKPLRTITFTSVPPRRRDERQQSIAVLPPPRTMTR